MFSFFRKKQNERISKDLVFINTSAKQKAIKHFLADNPDTLLLTWFEESYDKAISSLPGRANMIYMARELSTPQPQQAPFIFYEHHPLLSKEKEWLEKNNQKEIVFYSSLDEPLFLFAGGANIAGLVQKLGMPADEAINHPLISRSIDNARQKLAGKILSESPARSQEEWFEKNIKGNP